MANNNENANNVIPANTFAPFAIDAPLDNATSTINIGTISVDLLRPSGLASIPLTDSLRPSGSASMSHFTTPYPVNHSIRLDKSRVRILKCGKIKWYFT